MDGFDKKSLLLIDTQTSMLVVELLIHILVGEIIALPCAIRGIDLDDYKVVDINGNPLALNALAVNLVKRTVFILCKDNDGKFCHCCCNLFREAIGKVFSEFQTCACNIQP
jgi:hypothetical protein